MDGIVHNFLLYLLGLVKLFCGRGWDWFCGRGWDWSNVVQCLGFQILCGGLFKLFVEISHILSFFLQGQMRLVNFFSGAARIDQILGELTGLVKDFAGIDQNWSKGRCDWSGFYFIFLLELKGLIKCFVRVGGSGT